MVTKNQNESFTDLMKKLELSSEVNENSRTEYGKISFMYKIARLRDIWSEKFKNSIQ